MVQTPEYKVGEKPAIEEGEIKEIPETPEETPAEREQNIQVTPTQVTAKVADDSGKPIMQSPATKTVTITIPATQQKLTDLSKGSPSDSITWLANFWIRLIKKAIHFGWQIIGGEEKKS